MDLNKTKISKLTNSINTTANSTRRSFFKWIALAFMTMDHIRLSFPVWVDENDLSSLFYFTGRLAFPMFAALVGFSVYSAHQQINDRSKIEVVKGPSNGATPAPLFKQMRPMRNRLLIWGIVALVLNSAVQSYMAQSLAVPILNVLLTFYLGVCLSASMLDWLDQSPLRTSAWHEQIQDAFKIQNHLVAQKKSQTQAQNQANTSAKVPDWMMVEAAAAWSWASQQQWPGAATTFTLCLWASTGFLISPLFEYQGHGVLCVLLSALIFWSTSQAPIEGCDQKIIKATPLMQTQQPPHPPLWPWVASFSLACFLAGSQQSIGWMMNLPLGMTALALIFWALKAQLSEKEQQTFLEKTQNFFALKNQSWHWSRQLEQRTSRIRLRSKSDRRPSPQMRANHRKPNPSFFQKPPVWLFYAYYAIHLPLLVLVAFLTTGHKAAWLNLIS